MYMSTIDIKKDNIIKSMFYSFSCFFSYIPILSGVEPVKSIQPFFIPSFISRSKLKLIYNFLLFILVSLLLFSIFSVFNINVTAQTDFLFEEQIKAQAITRFWQYFSENNIKLSWIPFQWEMADEYKIFKSINGTLFEAVKADYQDEGFQMVWLDKDVLDRNTYAYYVEGYKQGELVGRTEQVVIDFWLPSCTAIYPVNNEIISEEEPEFRWESISINTFPYKNIIFSAESEFVIYDSTEEKEIWRIAIEDINTNKFIYDLEEIAKPFQKKHLYQWQYKVIGYNSKNQAIAESITGGLFSFKEAAEGEEEKKDEEDEYIEGKLNIDAAMVSYQTIEGEDVIVAQENVWLTYEDISLKANQLQIFLDRNELTARENVTFTVKDESYSCQLLNYNWKTDKVVMEEFSGETTGENIKGFVYYTGGRMENFPDTVEISSGFFTTCDLENPHWHIEAEKITIYLDDKIVAKKVSWYEGDKKIITLPSFLIFLRGKNQLPYIPDIGQSSSEGWFLKNKINYVKDADSYGSVYVDLMQKKGLGTGIEHTFELGEDRADDGEVILYLYALKRKAANIYDLDANINYWQNFKNDLKLKANVNYAGVIRADSFKDSSHIIKPDFYIYKKWEESLLTVTGKYNFNIRNSKATSSGDIKAVYDSTISDDLSSNLVLLYSSKSSQESIDKFTEQWIRPIWQLKYGGPGYTLNLTTEKLIDLHFANASPGNRIGSVSTLDRLPELIFNKDSAELFNTGISYSINASIGRFYESATEQENIRGEYIINLNKPIKINNNIGLNASGIYRQDVYLTGEARYMLGGRLDLRVGYQPEFYGNFSYSYYMSEGPTPFIFDALSPLTETASASIVLKPIDSIQLNLSTNYNFVTESFGSLGARLQWIPKKDYDINLSTYYDLNKKEWNKRIDAKMALKMSDDWKLSYSGSIYFDDFDIKNSVISVVRDLHCREISINYRQSTKSVWVDFSIKAFPTESFSIGG